MSSREPQEAGTLTDRIIREVRDNRRMSPVSNRKRTRPRRYQRWAVRATQGPAWVGYRRRYRRRIEEDGVKTYTVLATRSGDHYAVELDGATILRVVGPCRVIDGRDCDPETDTPLTRDMIRDWLDNAGTDAVDDAAWLAEARIRELGVRS